MKIAINGAGIAGPTLAYWLLRYGFEPILVEQAPRVRSAGYVIDFWGAGYDIAERMGILPEVLSRGYKVRELRLVDPRGNKVGGFPVDVFGRLVNGRFTSLPRGDLATTLFKTIEGKVETLFSESITGLEQHRDGVRVTLARGQARDVDLVIGADGLRSAIRRVAFGPDESFEQYLGYCVAAFETEGYRPRDELVYVAFTLPGRQVARFALRNDRTLFLFVFREGLQGTDARDSEHAATALLHRIFADAGWECPQILAAMESCNTLYFDRMSQIRISEWSTGRVALVGDAAFCVSFLAGEGAGLAMAAAYVLAGELYRAGGDHAVAFAEYQTRLHDFIRAKQKSAERFASWFAPRTRVGLFVRNMSSRLMSFGPFAELVIGPSLRDDIDMPDYRSVGEAIV